MKLFDAISCDPTNKSGGKVAKTWRTDSGPVFLDAFSNFLTRGVSYVVCKRKDPYEKYTSTRSMVAFVKSASIMGSTEAESFNNEIKNSDVPLF